MVGKIASPEVFEPVHAIIVKDKDDVLMPLLLDPLPTPGEFRDAISSLSPEQQRFAKAFRAMQLESTLFACLVVQIKPQLETLLGLPQGALTKEIALTQQLMDLFIEYQVPSDLLTYAGEEEAPLADKLAQVRKHAASLMDMVKASKQQQLDEERQRAHYADPLRGESSDQSDVEEEECDEGVAPEAVTRGRRMMLKKKGGAARGAASYAVQKCAPPPPAPPMMMMSALGPPGAPAPQMAMMACADEAPQVRVRALNPEP